jgi:LPS-assembly protein
MRWRLLVFFGLFLCSAALAETKLYDNIKAARVQFDEKTGIFDAKGSVEGSFIGGTVNADHFRFDPVAGFAVAEGEVSFVTKDYILRSQRLYYDISSEAITVSGLDAEFSPQEIPGMVYFHSGGLYLSKKAMRAERGKITTCDLGEPHYHLLTGRLNYEEGKTFEGGNVTFFAGDLPVFWMPYLNFSFGQQDKQDIQVGHNQVEGNYVKTGWGFPRGRMLVDYIGKKGWGYGTELYPKAGTFLLYHLDEQDTGIPDWIEKVEYQRDLTPGTQMRLAHSYISNYFIPSGRIEQTAFNYDLKDPATYEAWKLNLNGLTDRTGMNERYSAQFFRYDEDRSTDYFYNYEYSLGNPGRMVNSSRYASRFPVVPKQIYLNTNLDYFHNINQAGEAGEEKVEPVLELSGSGSIYSWRLAQNWLFDLRQDQYPGRAHYEFLEKHPELELSFNPVDLNYFMLQPSLGYGAYRESRFVPGLKYNREFSSQKYRGTVDLFSPVSLGFGTDLIWGVGFDQALYSSRDKLYTYREAATIQTDYGLFVRNTVSYRKSYTRGNSPFFFDRLGADFHDIYERLVFYHLNRFAWSFEGGRNWRTGKWFDLMTRVMLAPTERFSFSLDTGWDIENRRYKDLSTSIAIKPYPFLSAEVAVVHNPNQGEMRSASALYRLTLLQGEVNQTFIEVNQGYDPVTREMKIRDIMLVKDLHCWQMKYGYSDYLKQFSVTFSLMAIPGEPIGFGPQRTYAETTQEREVKRY